MVWLHIVTIIVDGASSNLSMIKLWTERRKGAYSVRVDEAEDKHNYSEAMHGFLTHSMVTVYFVICPSHKVLSPWTRRRMPTG